MTHLSDLFPLEALDAALADHLVVRRKHPDYDLYILNYTARVQYERGLWNAVTTQCRGLIHDGARKVVARPFRKFFNHGQAEAPQMDPTEPVVVSDKLDGSLGILYPTPGGFAIATRGSFVGEQAVHATALLRERYPAFRPPAGLTMLYEVIYPANRIVLDYGELDDLVLLGAVDVETGRSVSLDHPTLAESWDGPLARLFPHRTLVEALAHPPRKNAEGLVIHFTESDERVKLKQEDYVALHRIVTGLNEKTVWECLRDGKPYTVLLEALPDEFHGWVGEVAERLTGAVVTLAGEVERTYSTILADLPEGWTRKDYAMRAVKSPERAALFLKLDGRSYAHDLWERVKPEAPKAPRVFSEDNA